MLGTEMQQAKIIVETLRREGIDANLSDEVDVDGQPSIDVGPKGLDPARMNLGETGICFRLWEINDPKNKALFAARKFHEIVESRPPDWKAYRRRPR
jgi:hypothetical protein